MDTELKYIRNDEVDKWIDSLYKDNATFDIEFEGRKLKFNKRMSLELAFRIREQNEEKEQLYTMIAILSVQPKLSKKQAAKLPQDLLSLIQIKLEEFFPQKK